MLALNPPPNTLERFLQEPDGNQYAQIARKWLQKLMERGVPGYRGLALQWGRKDVSHDARGILGYVEWYGDGNVKINVPYPHTPYQLEVFLHELGHIWLAHDIKNACNGKTRNCRPENRQEFEAESWAMDVLRQEGIPISDDMFSDAQDYVTGVLFGDMKDGLPISRDAVKFIEINDRLKAHDGWADFLEDLEGAQMINPFFGRSRDISYGDHVKAVFKNRKGEGERMWVRVTKVTPTTITGTLENQPVFSHGGLRLGSVVRVKRSEVIQHMRGNPAMRNPAEAAEEVYEEFHGAPSEHITEISEEEHYHSHLAELGVLKGLKFRAVDGEKDITLDFDCDDCDHERSGNLFGFGGGSKKMSGSSRLMREAFNAGYNGSGGYRGTEEFKEWLAGVESKEDLTRSFKKRLKVEYMRGMKNWQKEGEVAAELGKKRGKGSAAAARGTQYATAVARRNRRKGPLASAAEFTGSMAHGAVQGVDSFFTGNPVEYMTDEYGLSKPIIPDAPRPLHKLYGPHWQDRPDRAEIEREWRQGTSARSAALKAYKKYVDESNRLYRERTGNPADGDGPVILCSNEDKNQLYFVGGDQSVDLFELKLDTRHDSMILGECWAVNYTTEKKFDDFAQIEYVHIFGPEDAQTEPRKNDDLWEDAIPPDEEVFGSGLLPTLRYDVLNQTLHLDGGSYFVTDKGIEE